MSMPKGVPQSPMWFSRATSWPTNVEHPAERVADDRGPEVADVHLLGHVGGRVVDDHGLRWAPADPEAGVVERSPPLGGDEGGREGEVDEAGPADLDRSSRRRARSASTRSARPAPGGCGPAAWPGPGRRWPGSRPDRIPAIRGRRRARPDRRRRAVVPPESVSRWPWPSLASPEPRPSPRLSPAPRSPTSRGSRMPDRKEVCPEPHPPRHRTPSAPRRRSTWGATETRSGAYGPTP